MPRKPTQQNQTKAQGLRVNPAQLAASMQNGAETPPPAEETIQRPPAETLAPSPGEPLVPASISIALPAGSLMSGYATRSVNCKLTPRQAAAAKMLWNSASNQGKRYAGGPGRHPGGSAVQSIHGGICMMLDRYADEFERSTGSDLVQDFDLSFR